jgi:hypothetical protein
LLKNAGDSKAALLQPAIGRQRRNMELSFHPSIRGGSIIQERIVDFGTQPTGAHLRRVDDRKGLLFRTWRVAETGRACRERIRFSLFARISA